MATRVQHILLNFAIVAVTIGFVPNQGIAQSDQREVNASDLNTEYFDVGLVAGIVNLQDFPSEVVYGLSATFRSSEDFFLQFNYAQANVSLSSYEKNQGRLFSGDDRIYQHYDFLVGYNIFQGEFFTSGTNANLSALYAVAGIGDTDFGGEASFTYTLGVGYQVAFKRLVIFRLDYRNFFYSSNLLLESETTQNSQLTLGVSYLF